MATPRLNLFQKLLRQWDALHPYNAVQVMHLHAEASMDIIERTWRETHSLLPPRQFPSCPVVRTASSQMLEDVISEELNRPFKAGDSPFRPIVLSRDGGCFVGIVYHHWAADSASIRQLTREWFLRIHHPEQASGQPISLPSGGYWRHLGPASAGWSSWDGLLYSMRQSSRMRCVRRLTRAGSKDFSCRWQLHRLRGAIIEPLMAVARRRGVTLNDILLAAAAEACQRHVPHERASHRPNMAMGTIADLRPIAKPELTGQFGLFLGFTTTVLRPRDWKDFDALLDTVAMQSKLHRRNHAAVTSCIRMATGLAAGRLLRRDKLVQFYRKRLPLAGGISNVNLNRDWGREHHPAPLLEYIRASPAGPMMPVVFTPTTLGSTLHFGMTYRMSVISASIAAELANTFMSRLYVLSGIKA